MANSVVFPWPPKELSPNAREHWGRKARAAGKYKTACFWLAREAKLGKDWGDRVHVAIEFVPPDRRARDLDNMLSSCKALLDGLAMAIGVDDKRFTLSLSVAPEIGGMVRVKLT